MSRRRRGKPNGGSNDGRDCEYPPPPPRGLISSLRRSSFPSVQQPLLPTPLRKTVSSSSSTLAKFTSYPISSKAATVNLDMRPGSAFRLGVISSVVRQSSSQCATPTWVCGLPLHIQMFSQTFWTLPPFVYRDFPRMRPLKLEGIPIDRTQSIEVDLEIQA